MDPLEAFNDHRAHAQQVGALGRPVTAGTGAVFLARDHHHRRAIGLVAHRCVIDRHDFALVLAHPAFDAGDHFVLDADVGKGAAHHHFMMAAARAVRVEVGLGDLMLHQPLARRAVSFDVASRADVVGGDRIAQHQQGPRIDDVLHRGRGHGHALKIGRVGDIGAARAPLVGFAAGDVDRLPVRVALVDVGIAGLEHLAGNAGGHGAGDFEVRRPDVLEIDVLPVRALTDRSGDEIFDHRALERIGHYQGRAGEEVGADIRRDAAFEVAVARDHCGGDQPVVVDRLADRLSQGTGVADAGGAAIADQIEADVVEVALEPRFDQVVGDDLAARCQRSLDPRLGLEAQLVGFLGDEAGGDQHARVRRIGAAGDRRDHHVAVADIEILALNRHADVGALVGFGHVLGEDIIHIGQRNAVLRALGPGERGDNGAHVEFERRGEHRIGGIGVDPEALLLGIGFDQRDLAFLAAGEAQVIERLVVDSEEAAGSAVFWGHVGQGRAVGQAQRGEARAEVFDKAAHHAVLAQQVGAGQHQIGRGHAFAERAGQLEADHFGDQHRNRLAQHCRLGLDPADAPAQHAEAVDHRGVAVGTNAGVGVSDGRAVLVLRGPDRLGDVFQVDLVADPGARGDRVEVVERLGTPLEEVIAFHVAVVFDLDVLFEGLGVAEFVDHHRVVDHQVDRDQRVDLGGIAAKLGDRIAHRRQIDHAGHAGEILQQHAGRAVLDFVRAFGRVLLPIHNRLDVGGGDGEAAVLKTQQVFQQDLHRERKPADIAKLGRGLLERIVSVVLAAQIERGASAERVLSDLGHANKSPGLETLPLTPLSRCSKAVCRRRRCARNGFRSRGGRSGLD